MLKLLIDENLPYYFGLWNNDECIHVFDIPEVKSDNDIWEYAKINDLTIITKDADFSNRIMFSTPPPKVIHLKIGNFKMEDLYQFLNKIWISILEEVDTHKLINVYANRIESFE